MIGKATRIPSGILTNKKPTAIPSGILTLMKFTQHPFRDSGINKIHTKSLQGFWNGYTVLFLNIFQSTIPAGVRGLEKSESWKSYNYIFQFNYWLTAGSEIIQEPDPLMLVILRFLFFQDNYFSTQLSLLVHSVLIFESFRRPFRAKIGLVLECIRGSFWSTFWVDFLRPQLSETQGKPMVLELFGDSFLFLLGVHFGFICCPNLGPFRVPFGINFGVLSTACPLFWFCLQTDSTFSTTINISIQFWLARRAWKNCTRNLLDYGVFDFSRQLISWQQFRTQPERLKLKYI